MSALERKQINQILSTFEALFDLINKDGTLKHAGRYEKLKREIERLRGLVVIGEFPVAADSSADLRVENLRRDARAWRKRAETRPLRKTVVGSLCIQIARNCDLIAELLERR